MRKPLTFKEATWFYLDFFLGKYGKAELFGAANRKAVLLNLPNIRKSYPGAKVLKINNMTIVVCENNLSGVEALILEEKERLEERIKKLDLELKKI